MMSASEVIAELALEAWDIEKPDLAMAKLRFVSICASVGISIEKVGTFALVPYPDNPELGKLDIVGWTWNFKLFDKEKYRKNYHRDSKLQVFDSTLIFSDEERDG